MTQQNSEFEKWATKHIVSKRLLEFNTMKYENGMYKSHIMQRKFEAWQAAKADSERQTGEMIRAISLAADAREAELQSHINVLRKALEDVLLGTPLDEDKYNRDDDDLHTFKHYRCVNLSDRNMVAKWEQRLETALASTSELKDKS